MKVTFFDTESTSLTANWGRILCASFVDLGEASEVKTYRRDVKPYVGRTKVGDERLCVAIRNELERSDIIVGWNSILHDIPLLNARLTQVGERPAKIGEKYGTSHLDLMYYAGGQSMKIGGRSLATVSKFFGVDHEKTPLDGETWQLAAANDVDAMDLVAEHCEADVLVTRDVFPYLAPSVKKFQFPLGDVWNFLEAIPSRKSAA